MMEYGEIKHRIEEMLKEGMLIIPSANNAWKWFEMRCGELLKLLFPTERPWIEKRHYRFFSSRVTLPYKTWVVFGKPLPIIGHKGESTRSNLVLEEGTKIEMSDRGIEVAFEENVSHNSIHIALEDIREITLLKRNPDYRYGKPANLMKTVFQVPLVVKGYRGERSELFVETEWR